MSSKRRYEVLTDTHTHADKPCKKGDIIEVSERSAAALKGVLKPMSSFAKSAPADKPVDK